jgi:adenylate cyclase class 2
MIEVEVKARALPDTRQKILSMGAVPAGIENHHDIYFSSPLRSFQESDEALRIRIKEEGARLTYKGPKLDLKTKSRREVTVEIDDPVGMEEILASLNFSPTAVVRKRRTKYKLGPVTFALDEVEGLGSFLEVEMSGEAEWQEQQSRVLEVLEQLGLKESIRKSYLELLDENRKITTIK